MENKKYFECSCSGEILRIEKDDEDNTLSVAIYNIGNYPYDLSFWQRFKLSIKFLFRNQDISDSLILEEKSINELKKWLNENYETRQRN